MEATELTIRSDGDQIERDNWELLALHIHHYEVVWRLLVAPLRSSGSIYLRDGIDEVFEFAMCHYTTYVNLARALAKIDASADDLKFSEEIWANMHRAAEVAIKAVAAFRTIYKDSVMPRKHPAVNTSRLEKLEGTLKKYRNILHDPIMGTAKDQGVRLLPRRELLQKYHRWTSIMYHRKPEDFVPVISLLRSDFAALCSTLQNVWKEIELSYRDLQENDTFLKRLSAGISTPLASTATPDAASGDFIVPLKRQ